MKVGPVIHWSSGRGVAGSRATLSRRAGASDESPGQRRLPLAHALVRPAGKYVYAERIS